MQIMLSDAYYDVVFTGLQDPLVESHFQRIRTTLNDSFAWKPYRGMSIWMNRRLPAVDVRIQQYQYTVCTALVAVLYFSLATINTTALLIYFNVYCSNLYLGGLPHPSSLAQMSRLRKLYGALLADLVNIGESC